VLITGASSGLGAELARLYASRGVALTLMGRNPDRLRAAVDRCRAEGASATGLCCDVRDAAAMQAHLLEADARLPLSTVIANSGIGGIEVMARQGHEPAELARQVVDVNLLGVINTIAPLQQAFIARKRGTFAVVSSMAAFEGLAEAPAYAAAKAAVRIYGHGLRRLLAPHGIHVGVVTPGFVATPMSASLPLTPPFLWTAERAARRIVLGLDRKEAEIAFPFAMRAGVGLARMLPVRVVDLALRLLQTRLEQPR
jgi:short-subunit dehydrogenase